MDIKTYTSILVLTLLVTSSAVMAMDNQDRKRPSTPRAMLVEQDTPPTMIEPSRSLLSRLTWGYLGESSEQLPSYPERLSTPRAMLVEQDTLSITPAPSSSVLSWVTFGYLGASSAEQLPHTYQEETDSFPFKPGDLDETTLRALLMGDSPAEQLPSSSAPPPSPASSSIDQDPQSATPLTRLVQVSWNKMCEVAIIEENKFSADIKITSDHGRVPDKFPREMVRLVESNRFPITSGESIEVTYSITASDERRVGLDLLNSKRDGCYLEANRVLLKKGRHKDTFRVVVPEGESETSFIFFNDRGVTCPPTNFTIHYWKIEVSPPPLPSAPSRTWGSVFTFGLFDASPAEQLPHTYQAETDSFPFKPGDLDETTLRALLMGYNFDASSAEQPPSSSALAIDQDPQSEVH